MAFYERERSPANSYLYKEINENLNFARHMHRSIEFIDILEGEITLTLYDSNSEYVLNSGQALIILPYQVHSYRTEKYSKYIMTIFSLDYVRTFYDMVRNKTAETPVFSFTDSELSYKLLRTPESDVLMHKSYLYSVCASFASQTAFTDREKSNINLLDHIIEYVENHYTENITLKQIAEERNYNYHYISNFFNSHIGINFRRFLNEYRIHHACILLKEENRSITEAAHMSGYDTLRSFNREFLNITGTTPSEFKKQADIGTGKGELTV